MLIGLNCPTYSREHALAEWLNQMISRDPFQLSKTNYAYCLHISHLEKEHKTRMCNTVDKKAKALLYVWNNHSY